MHARPSLDGSAVYVKCEQDVDSSPSTPDVYGAGCRGIGQPEPWRMGSPLQAMQNAQRCRRDKKRRAMHPGKENMAPERRAPALDDECVVGLLSLSHGQWK